MALVFQYGSNMSTARLNAETRLRGHARPVGIAITEGEYEFTFDIWSSSKENQCAAADIVAGNGRRIWGVIYDVPDRLISRETSPPDKSLDAIEGAGNNYQQVEINLRWRNGRPVTQRVITYIGANRKTGIQTTSKYAEHILKGLTYHKMPSGYVAYVRARIRANNPQLQLPSGLPA